MKPAPASSTTTFPSFHGAHRPHDWAEGTRIHSGEKITYCRLCDKLTGEVETQHCAHAGHDMRKGTNIETGQRVEWCTYCDLTKLEK